MFNDSVKIKKYKYPTVCDSHEKTKIKTAFSMKKPEVYCKSDFTMAILLPMLRTLQ